MGIPRGIPKSLGAASLGAAALPYGPRASLGAAALYTMAPLEASLGAF